MNNLNQYYVYYPPVSISRLHIEMASQIKQNTFQPEESFDLMLKKVTENSVRNNAPPPPTKANFNQLSFLRAGRTLELVTGLERENKVSVRDDVEEDFASADIGRNSSTASSQETTKSQQPHLESREEIQSPAETKENEQPLQKENNKDNFSVSNDLLEEESE